MNTSTWFSIQPATIADIPTLSKIAGDACANDRHTQMKETFRKKALSNEGNRVDPLAQWIPNSQKYSVQKAISDATGEIMGWVCWGRRGYGGEAAPTGNEAAMDNAPVEADAPTDPIERLEALTDADLRRWMAFFMPPGTLCMYIVSLAVSPSYHSRGVGSALIRFGTRKADQEGIFCWVHSSEAGQRVFEKEGFQQAGSLEVDLDEYAPVPSAKTGAVREWGMYTFRYMKRLPSTPQNRSVEV